MIKQKTSSCYFKIKSKSWAKPTNNKRCRCNKCNPTSPKRSKISLREVKKLKPYFGKFSSKITKLSGNMSDLSCSYRLKTKGKTSNSSKDILNRNVSTIRK